MTTKADEDHPRWEGILLHGAGFSFSRREMAVLTQSPMSDMAQRARAKRQATCGWPGSYAKQTVRPPSSEAELDAAHTDPIKTAQ